MKVSIQDNDALAAVTPIELSAYLRSTGWVEVKGIEGPIRVWERPLGEQSALDVRVPMHVGWRDYAAVVRELLETLAKVESRSQLAILRDLAEATSDVIRFRADPSGRSDGTINLEDSLRLSDCAYRVLFAAACATVEPKRAFPTRKAAKATEFMQSVRAGQTERGSYVFTLLSRVSPALSSTQTTLPHVVSPTPAAVPFSRSVVERLAHALQRMEAAALAGVSTGSMDAFEAAVPEGVSADLCDGIALLRASPVINRLDVSISWSPARPGPRDLPRLSSFTPETFEVLREAATRLRERAIVDDFELIGPVVELSRPGDTLFGEATIASTALEGRARKVTVELWDDAWTAAETALANRWLLRCEGELHRDTKPFSLRNARNVQVIAPTDD